MKCTKKDVMDACGFIDFDQFSREAMKRLLEAYDRNDALKSNYRENIIERSATGKTLSKLVDAATIIIQEGKDKHLVKLHLSQVAKIVNTYLEKI